MEPATQVTICLDPGHPSEVATGAAGPGGVTEIHLNWLVACELRGLLEADGLRVVLTKHSEDERVTNRRRAEIANESGAQLLLRLHCDDREQPGTAVYYPDREGRAQGATGPDPRVRARSLEAARIFYPALVAAMPAGWTGHGILGDSLTEVGRTQGALTGSVFSEVPVLTVEMISITNRSDAAFLSSEQGRRQMAEALRAGVHAWLLAH
jgi:N-acetylmuramoyl-L-alanine amidase